GPFTIPAIPPTMVVMGIAANPGPTGDIPAFDIDQPCCISGVVVKNTSAFTGGHDAQPNSVIEQKDIDGAASGLETTLRQAAQNDVRGQVHSNERVIDGSLQCQPRVSANHKAGDVAKSVTVQVAVTCGEQVYDYAAARQIAFKAQQALVAGDPKLGAAFALDG